MLLKRLFFISIVSFFAISANASVLPYIRGIIKTPPSGTPQVVSNTSSATSTAEITPPSTGLPFTDLTKKGMVTLAVNHHYQTFMSAYVAEITVSVQRFPTLSGSPLADTNVILKVSYQPNNPDSLTFVDRQTFTWNNVEKFKMVITNIKVNGSTVTVLPANLFVQGDVFVDRIYDFVTQTSLNPTSFNLTLAAPEDRDCDGVDDKITVSWQPVIGAEEYQLEWTYVNDYGLTSAPNVDFSKNSTRISTTKTNYDLSLVFDKGYVCFRVRAVGRSMQVPYRLLYTNWTIADGSQNVNATGMVKRQITQPYDILKNWQYSTTYAEEGKQKEVISFYDGSLRNRQMVTKINSDKNTIVGETIYDHLGRPMVQVLPAPVGSLTCNLQNKETSLKYYPGFNKNAAGEAYNAEDFAEFHPSDTCNPANAAGMNTNSGASNYYSTLNPNTQGSQGYVPNANQYPFSQVQYMPDNTGRVRSQGGVGQEFQLGNDHETKYFYAHPFQEQLDRLFGSEVGDAAHYQKNMVVDPNGQVSVSYLDQEGRVVATSLAGEAPDNVMPIPSQDAAGPLTVDLFAKDLNGNSASNVLSPDGMSKVFNQTIALSSESDVTINYGLQIDAFHNACLPANVCFECVYDLQIEVRDLCGKNFAPTYLSNKLTGHFTIGIDNQIEFVLSCDSTNYHPQFTIVDLPVGTYQVSKTLTINQAALEYYVNSYIDTTTMLNQCLQDFDSFEAEEQANSNIDDCEEDLTCAECVANLGGLVEFIQAGGTEEEYNLELAACNAPCKPLSYYETQRQIMLADVLPGGQYGEYIDNVGNVNVTAYPISVLNVNNSLPKTSAHWKNPKYDVESSLQNSYFEEDGATLSRIYLTNVVFNGSNQLSSSSPMVDTLAPLNVKVFFDPATNEYYSYPQYLKYVSDFIDYYMINPQWANSLIYFHPEYPILNIYKKYTTKFNPTDTYSSEEFDQKMQSINTFQEAQSQGILSGFPYSILNDSYAVYNSQLTSKVNNYMTINGVNYSMFEVAAMITRCPNSLVGYQPTATCSAFGTNVGTNTAQNTEIKNAEWIAFRGLYFAVKQELQLLSAKTQSITNPTYYGYNECIGNDNFNMFANGFYSSGGYTAAIQPCNATNFLKYKFKTIRFGNAAAFIDNDPNQVAYQMYLQTGQCPVGFALQNVFNQAATQQILDVTGPYSMNSLNSLSGLLMAINDFEVTGPLPTLTWENVTNSSSVLEFMWKQGSTPYATFRLQKNMSSPNVYSWDEITSFNNLQYTLINSGLYEFTVDITVNQTDTTFTEKLTGNTTLKIGGCSFPETCVMSDQGKAVEKMMKLLAINNQLTSASPLNIHTSPYTPFFTTTFEYAVNPSPVGAGTFQYDSSLPGFVFVDGTSTLKLTINSTIPTTFNLTNLNLIADLSLEAGPNNTFKLNGLDASGAYLVTLECDAIRYNTSGMQAVSFGSCGLGDNLLCHGIAYSTFDDLANLLKHEIFPDLGQFELMNSPYWTNTLQGLLSQTATSIPGNVATISGGKQLTFNFPGTCDLVLTTHTSAITFMNIVSVNEMHVYGPEALGGGYYNFYLLVTYNNGTSNVNDTIFGTSCLKLKECIQCENQSQAQNYTPTELEEINNSLKIMGILEADNTIISYVDYLQIIEATNIRLGWDENHPNHLIPIPYQDYFDHGLANLLAGYLQYASIYIDGIDDYEYLSDPMRYLDRYGSGDNLLANYDRYLNAVTQYNMVRNSYGFAPVEVISLSVFSQSVYSNDCSDYLTYLDAEYYNIATILPLSNYPNSQAAMIDSSACLDAYNDYFFAYQAFVNAQSSSNTCMDYEITMPLVPYQSFIDNNLCCSSFGFDVLADYINSFSISNTCPGALPFVDDCTTPEVVDIGMCTDNWYLYTTYVEDYNNSAWAHSHEGEHMPVLYPVFSTFLQMGYCACVEDYNAYLQTYINAAPEDTLPAPISIDEFCGLNEVDPSTTPCQQEYESYLHCVAEYNEKAIEQGEEYVLDLVTMEAFYENSLCYCVDDYCSQLNMVLDGLSEYSVLPNLFTFCSDRFVEPCVQAADSIAYETFEMTFNDPCTEFYQSNIEVNALIAYTTQIQTLQTEIAQQYIKHCMTALENMTMTYNEIEHHFTLYYYDQAGNLIKTVPPEGVEFVDISDSIVKLGIKKDRENNTHLVVTSHRMATNYVYNSLNQLVSQNMPDQDAMTIFEAIAPNGLPVGLNTTAIQMIDANQGYLTGYITNTNVPLQSRGYLFKTTNGGNNWVRVTTALGANLKEVAFVSSTLGYAIANDGMILKTADGGFNWDLLNTASSNVYSDFISIEVVGSTAYVLNAEGKIFGLTTSGLAATSYAPPALPSNYSIVSYKDFTLQNTAPTIGSDSILYLVRLNHSISGVVADYVLRNTSPSTIEQVQVLDLKTAGFYTNDLGIAAGVDGNISLLTGTSATNFKEFLKPSGTIGTIDQLFMVNENIGLARIDENGNKEIRKTIDGGVTWETLSNPYTNAFMTMVKSSSNSKEILIQGYANNKAYSKVIVLSSNGIPIGEVNQTPNLAQNINLMAVSAFVDGSNITYFGIDASMKLYRSNTFSSSTTDVTFTEITSAGLLPFTAKEMVVLKNGSGVSIEVLATNGTVYRTFANSLTGTYSALTAVSGLTAIVGVDKMTLGATNYLIAINQSNILYGKVANSTSAFTCSTSFNPAITSVIQDLIVHGNKISLVGSNGGIFTSAGLSGTLSASTTVAFTNRMNHAFGNMTSLSTRGNKVVVTGENGMVATAPLGTASTKFTLREMKTVEHLYNASYRVNGADIYFGFVGSNGYFEERKDVSNVWTAQPTYFTTYGISLANYSNGKSLRSVAVQGQSVYLVGDNGNVYYTSNINQNLFIPVPAVSTAMLKSVVYIPSANKALAVGDDTEMYRFTDNFSTRLAGAHLPKLVDINFETGQYGSVVGINYFLRTSNTGGNSWSLIKPSFLKANILTSSEMSKVATRKNQDGTLSALVGTNSSILAIKGNTLTSSLAVSSAVSDLQFGPANRLLMYAAKGTDLISSVLTESNNTFTFGPIASLATSPASINAIHVFDQGSVIMVGAGGKVHYYNNSTSSQFTIATISGTPTLNDVYFRDHKSGVAVGQSGKFYYFDVDNIDPITHDILSTSSFQANQEMSSDPIINSQNYHIKAIAYNDLNHAVYGGSYTVSSDETTKAAFVRSLKQERNLYSARFFYDRLGRIVVSQNTRQRIENKYSYTLYDGLGRVFEAGEKTENSTATTFNTIFGTYVGGSLVATVVDDNKLSTWLNTQSTTTRKEVTRSYYDNTNSAIASEINSVFAPDSLTQRKRIVHVTYEAVYDGLDNTYDHATHYDYDIHGNVKTLIQDNRSIYANNDIKHHRFKRMDYVYDLISGNVHRVDYQTGNADQWHHAYQYDADNRITDVNTSTETPITTAVSSIASLQNEPVINPLWDQEAEYSYYAHGPLARTVLGDEKVQGLDYVYTLQGWIKGVNSNTLDPTRDPGQDGVGLSNNHYVAKDVYGYSLHYFQGDYAGAIGGNNSFVATQPSNGGMRQNSHDLYNGNIARMVTTITDPNTRQVLALGNAYKYDQLNRLKEARSFNNINLSGNSWNSGGTQMYYNAFDYDANGNIVRQDRRDENGNAIDQMEYYYEDVNGNLDSKSTNPNMKVKRNRLHYVDDQIDYDATDINPGMASDNYFYDAEGRLVKDDQEEIRRIYWRVDGKVKKIIRTSGSQKKNVSFDYDAMGHRITKHVYTSANVWEKSTYYVLDAQGNTLSTYEYVNDNQTQTLTYAQTEKHIYGSSRLGVNTEVVPMFGSQNATYSMKLVQHKIGQRTYELSNHLGNVLSIISDKVIPHQNGSSVDYWLADIRHSQDYSPFGVTLHGRDLSLSTTGNKPYRFGFQNQEEDSETGLVNYKYRMHNQRIGRFFAIDPLYKKYPYLSSYQFSSNQPIHTYELEGAESNNELSGNIQIGLQLNLGGSSNNVRGFASVNTNAPIGGMNTLNTGLSFNLFTGGLGTTQGTTGKSKLTFEFNMAVGITLGGSKTTTPMSMDVYNSSSGVTVTTMQRNSVSMGLVLTGNTNYHKAHKVGYIYGRFSDFSFGTYNDIFAPDNNDSYWTGGQEFQYAPNEMGKIQFHYDAYTGQRPGRDPNNNDQYPTKDINGRGYYDQSPGQNLFNNGQTTLKCTIGNYSIGFSSIGGLNALKLQNRIHDNWPLFPPNKMGTEPINRFESNSKQSVQLQLSYIFSTYIH